jgi:uncharacterized protein (TIGR03435 family)
MTLTPHPAASTLLDENRRFPTQLSRVQRYIRFMALALTLVPIHAQSFEVASVRPSDPKARWGGIEITPGRFHAANVSVRAIFKQAFRARDFQIANPPAWFDSQWYEITATTEPGATENSINIMLQNLLADRFALKLHRESKEMQVYALIQSKNGTKLQPVANDEKGGVRRKGAGIVAGTKASLQQLCEALSDVKLNGSAILDRPVVDRTGLSGKVYDFTLTWTPEPGQFGLNSTFDNAGPSLFTAVQEQLGLKLETQKAQVEIFVIDHLEKPGEN